MINENDNVLNESEDAKQPVENSAADASLNPTVPENTETPNPVETSPLVDEIKQVEAVHNEVADENAVHIEKEAETAKAVDESPVTKEQAHGEEFGTYVPEAAAVIENEILNGVEHAPSEEEIAEHQQEQTNYASLGKEELIEELNKLVALNDVKATRVKVRVIRDFFNEIIHKENREHLVEFLNDGGLKEEFTAPENPLKDKFDALYTKFRGQETEERRLKERELENNLKAKKEILEQLRTLIENEENDRKVFEKFHEIQNQWRQIGNIAPAEVTHVWRTYNHYTTLIYNHIRQHRELRDLDMKKNLELKTELAQKAEELIAEPSVKKILEEVKGLQEKWKQIGPVPKAQSDEIWNRFKSAVDKVYERRGEYFDQMKGLQEQNLQLKLALIEKAEEVSNKDVKSAKDAQALTDEINKITDQWKSIGYAPKEQNEEIWKRFRAITKVFFDKRDDFYKEIKTEQHNNLKKKTDLCVQAEALATSTDWKRTTNELIRLQQEWKAIGPIPKRYSDKLWTRFRAACDAFFNTKQSHFGSLAESEGENLVKKNDLIARIEGLELGDDAKANIGLLNEIQNEWASIGHVPIKEKEALYKRYREALDKKFDSIKASTKELGAMRYKSKIEGLKGGNDGDNQLRRERSHWQQKAGRIKADIITLQNNIEFFARSKNAEELRKNVEKQINDAKKELAEVEEKLKMLREVGA